MKAHSFLEKAIETLAERGGHYESGQEENSMWEIVALHSEITPDNGGVGTNGMSELEGWFFMLALKLVRLRKSIEQGKASKDSIVDLLGYTAKMGECLFSDEPTDDGLSYEMDHHSEPRGPLLTPQDCLHISCTMKDIEDRLVIVCDDCPKQFTAKEFVDNECEAR